MNRQTQWRQGHVLRDEDRVLELRHTIRRSLSWKTFTEVAERDTDFNIDHLRRQTLRRWLAARYGRPSFPSSFEDRLRSHGTSAKNTLEKRFANLVKSQAQFLVGVYFDLGEDRHVELVHGEPYVLRVIVLYDYSSFGAKAKAAAEQLVPQIEALFAELCGAPGLAQGIELEACEAQSDTEFKASDWRRVDQWRLEYVSLGSDDNGASLSSSEGA